MNKHLAVNNQMEIRYQIWKCSHDMYRRRGLSLNPSMCKYTQSLTVTETTRFLPTSCLSGGRIRIETFTNSLLRGSLFCVLSRRYFLPARGVRGRSRDFATGVLASFGFA